MTMRTALVAVLLCIASASFAQEDQEYYLNEPIRGVFESCRSAAAAERVGKAFEAGGYARADAVLSVYIALETCDLVQGNVTFLRPVATYRRNEQYLYVYLAERGENRGLVFSTFRLGRRTAPTVPPK